MTAHLQVASLSAGYGAVPVLQDVSLQVERGEIVAVIGANGAGKTTLLLAISGHLALSAGRIAFAGVALEKQPAHRTVARGLVMVPEGGRLFPFMTVLENLELGAYHRQARARLRESLDEVLTLFPILAERRRQLAGRLSGGERTMAAIARAMMGLPQLLLLDEPSLGLSPLMVARVFEMIRTLVRLRGLSVLLVEQNVAEALLMCGRAYVLERGRVTKSGTGAALARDEDVQRAYMGF
jgi:branched-chain amino acid transport system ATP-binding protein